MRWCYVLGEVQIELGECGTAVGLGAQLLAEAVRAFDRLVACAGLPSSDSDMAHRICAAVVLEDVPSWRDDERVCHRRSRVSDEEQPTDGRGQQGSAADA